MSNRDTERDAAETGVLTGADIEFCHVTKQFPGQRESAVTDLSFRIDAGEICCLVGPSGGGKTTTMKMINRLVDCTDGDILIGGRSVRTADPIELRRSIGYVIQEVGLFPHMTVAENIAVVPKLLGWSKDRRKQRTAELLELVNLPHEMGRRYPAQLSGGQRQRVGLARALAVDPPVMLMDEPFGALDPITRCRLQDEFLRLHRELRKTTVFVTHDIDEAIKMGDRIAVLRDGGHLAQYATADALLAHPADEHVANLVGADRGLRRLALRRAGDLAVPGQDRTILGGTAPDGGTAPGVGPGAGRTGPGFAAGSDALPAVSADATARIALSVLISAGAPAVTVVGDDGPVGVLTAERLFAALREPGQVAMAGEPGGPTGPTL
ncbi:MAG: ABC transporter ATP-binding protein [Streptosporangiaceae bacterium]